jgi:ADP-heptose:LPS heptosyltransferase
LSLTALVAHLPQGFEYISLQKELRPNDAQTLAKHPQIRHFGEQINDFADTAALCELMDIVISVDTSVAHLAGALGKPLWVLLPHAPDWRWLLDRTDSPWYPTARLFRANQDGHWQDALTAVQLALQLAIHSEFPKSVNHD